MLTEWRLMSNPPQGFVFRTSISGTIINNPVETVTGLPVSNLPGKIVYLIPGSHLYLNQ